MPFLVNNTSSCSVTFIFKSSLSVISKLIRMQSFNRIYAGTYFYKCTKIITAGVHVANFMAVLFFRPSPFLPNLEPGAYEFQVLASNNEGKWAGRAKTISITVLPAWWQPWWAGC